MSHAVLVVDIEYILQATNSIENTFIENTFHIEHILQATHSIENTFYREHNRYRTHSTGNENTFNIEHVTDNPFDREHILCIENTFYAQNL